MGTINDKLTYLNETKTAIKNAIVAKGVSVSANDTFRSYANKIGNIQGVEDLNTELSAQDTALSTQETKIAQLEQALNNKVALDLISATSDANATANDIVKDKTAYINGVKVVGTYAIGEIEENDVNFYDYEGTRVASYSKADFLALNEMPANPSHQGLTAQGWNWSLADAKSYVTDYGMLDIGQMYVTDDGKTRIYITLTDGRLGPYLGLALSGTATIDWGDGSTSQMTGNSLSYTNNLFHSYSKEGNYIITIDINGTGAFYADGNDISKTIWSGSVSGTQPNRGYANSIQKVELGNNIGISQNAFKHCMSLKNINSEKCVSKLCFTNNISDTKQCAIIRR